jgi:capsule polysaccharide export protein KpsE/RkpR
MTGLMREPQTTSPQAVAAVREKDVDSAMEDGALQSLRLLWRRRQTLGKVLVAGAVMGLVMAFLLPVKYQSSVQLMPPDSQQGLSLPLLAAMSQRSGSSLGMVAGDALGIKSSGSLFIGVLRSRTVEDRLIDKFSLKKVYGVRLEEQARNILQGNTNISEDRKSGIIAISVRDGDAKRATLLAQANVEELNHLVVELSTSAAHRERVFLEERLVTIKESLDQASREFSQFASKNAAIDIKEQGRAMVESAALLQGQWIAAESELRGLEAIYTPNNVRVRALQARISELRQQVQKMNGSEKKIAGDPDLGGADYPSLRTLPLLGVTYSDLYRRTRIEETVYETLTQQYELAKVEEAKETPSVKVLDSASVPERKVFPPRLAVICLSMAVASLVGFAAIIAKEKWRQIPPSNPKKSFVLEVLQSVKGSAASAIPNAAWQLGMYRAWKKVFPGASAEEVSGIANR